MASSPLENDIHEAIPLACDDMSTAGEVLEKIRARAILLNDKAALIACLGKETLFPFVIGFGFLAGRSTAAFLPRWRILIALVGVLVAVLSYLVNAIAMLWSKALFAKPYSLHSYFDPGQILVNGYLEASSVAVLAAIAALATAAAFLRFARRDLP